MRPLSHAIFQFFMRGAHFLFAAPDLFEAHAELRFCPASRFASKDDEAAYNQIAQCSHNVRNTRERERAAGRNEAIRGPAKSEYGSQNGWSQADINRVVLTIEAALRDFMVTNLLD